MKNIEKQNDGLSNPAMPRRMSQSFFHCHSVRLIWMQRQVCGFSPQCGNS